MKKSSLFSQISSFSEVHLSLILVVDEGGYFTADRPPLLFMFVSALSFLLFWSFFFFHHFWFSLGYQPDPVNQIRSWMCTHFPWNDGEDIANRLLEESTVQELDQNFDLGRYGLDLHRRHHRKSIASLPFLLRYVSSSHLSSFVSSAWCSGNIF